MVEVFCARGLQEPLAGLNDQASPRHAARCAAESKQAAFMFGSLLTAAILSCGRTVTRSHWRERPSCLVAAC